MPDRVHVTHFSRWAADWEPSESYLARFEGLALPVDTRAANAKDLQVMARLDRAWYAEITRCFSKLAWPGTEFVLPKVTGPSGLAQMLAGDDRLPARKWLVFEGHSPGRLAGILPKLLAELAKRGWKFLYYSFDESSRRLPAFKEIAPFLDVLIHDESPLAPEGAALLRAECTRVHHSWVANLIPFQAPWVEEPEAKILFLGSQLGLTPHRQRQIDFLRKRFKDKFLAICDHSVAVADRLSLGRYKVSVCPEGRMFATPTMGATHTDRPFWSGCLGMVPVSENSAGGGRLEELHRAKLILRYPHADLIHLGEQCEAALALKTEERRRIYDEFNRHETVGQVVAPFLVAA